MYRIIFFCQESRYGKFDADNYIEILDYPFCKEMKGKQIICIVSYLHRSFIYKSPDFDVHRDAADNLIFDEQEEQCTEFVYDYSNSCNIMSVIYPNR